MLILRRILCRFFNHQPSVAAEVYCFHIEYCPRCGKIFKKEKVRPSASELLTALNPWNEHGNQIW